MKSRVVMVVIAVVLGLMAAYGIFLYARGIKTTVEEENETAKILVAEEDIPIGAGVKKITEQKQASFKEVPKKYVASRAVTETKDFDGQVLAVPVNKGEQITTDHFKYNTKAGLAFTVPEDQLALSIAVDEVKGVSGMIKAGDLVTIIATLPTAKGTGADADQTKILLQNVKVLAVGKTIAPPKGRAEENKSVVSRTSSAEPAKKIVTFSLTPADSEKLVFAEEKGNVWLSLLPASEVEPVSTPGQTIETVFK